MLVVDNRNRMTAEAVLHELEQLHEKGTTDHGYIAVPRRATHAVQPINPPPLIQEELIDLAPPPLIEAELIDPAHPPTIQAELIDPTSVVTQGQYRRPRASVEGLGSYRSSLRSKHHPERKPTGWLGTWNEDAEGIGQSDIDDVQEDTHPGILKEIDKVVRQTLSQYPSSEVHEVTIQANWQLQQCVQEELDGDCNLGSFLTISGSGSHSWAASCQEYVETTWQELGAQFLQDLQLQLRQRC